MPIVWVPFNPDTGLIKPDSSGNEVGYVVGYISELGKASDFPDAEIVNDIIIPNFIPKFESEIIKNYDYDAIVKKTSTINYRYYSQEEASKLNMGEYGWHPIGTTNTENKDIKSDIKIDNKDKVVKEINSWVVTKYQTILKLLPGFYIVTERTLVNSQDGNTIWGSFAGGKTTTSSTGKTKSKEVIKGLRKLPRQLIKCKIRS